MSYEPVNGFSATVSINDGASQAFLPLAANATCNIPFGETKTFTFANLSGANRNLLKGVGMHDPGKFTATLGFTDVDYARLLAIKTLKYIATTVPVQWKVAGPTDSAGTVETVTFNGILLSVDVEYQAEAATEMKISVDVWGTTTYASA